MNYIYFGIFEFDGEKYEVTFPDLENIRTSAPTIEKALEQAEEVLEGAVVLYENIGKKIPEPRKIQTIRKIAKKFAKSFEIFPVRVNTKLALAKNNEQFDRKSVTIEHYLNLLAKENHINVSKVLNDALKEKFSLN